MAVFKSATVVILASVIGFISLFSSEHADKEIMRNNIPVKHILLKLIILSILHVIKVVHK
ncbi:hypothetical protein SDC9_141444 [bioreactor metagenome]|uniref:Uncharacterized protein n=1 Tax=bioreactor metagenome TaxID=1076179 RepID=A0A645DYT3_9ZZZZ